MRVIVFGGSGLLGRALVSELKKSEHLVLAPSHSELDILDFEKVLNYAKALRPDFLINCTGFNRVDDCESQAELAFKVNAEGAENLAKVSKESFSVLVQISSDYIFSGEKSGEYPEEEEPGPLNIYGKSKLEGERLVQKYTGDFCIIRTSWLFGPGGENFISKILKKWQEGAKELRVVSDEKGRPTYSKDLAKAIRLVVERGLRGIYHFCNQGAVSWFELAQEVFEIMGKGPKLIPITAKDYGLPAKRPKNSILSTKKIEQALGIKIRHHQEGIKEYLKETGII